MKLIQNHFSKYFLLLIVFSVFGFSKTASALATKTVLGIEYEQIHKDVLGDFNNDGKLDHAVCVPGYTPLGTNTAGAVRIYTTLLYADTPSSAATILLTGENTADRAGEYCAAGDFNKDGIDDLLVSSVYNNNSTGVIYLVLGSTGLVSGSLSTHIMMTGEGENTQAGKSVANAGDVNGDGYNDMLIGADSNITGAELISMTYLVLGSASPTSKSLADADAKYTGEFINDHAGYSVSGAGDVNFDGFDDIIIGASGGNDASGETTGAAYLILGSASPTSKSLADADAKYTGEASFDYAGSSVSGAGDVNGDGFYDMIIGANGNDASGEKAGAAYLVLGSALPTGDNLSTAIKFAGETAGDYAGQNVAKAGDMDKDGFDDFLIGAQYNSASFSEAGAVYLVYGRALPRSDTLSAKPRIKKFQGKEASANVGSFIGPGDAISTSPFFIIGAEYNDDGGRLAGKIWQQFKLPTATDGYKLTLP